MRTLREIADDLGLDKSTVFRFVKSAGIAPVDPAEGDAPRNGVQYYDATAEDAIKRHFEKKSSAAQRRTSAAIDATLDTSRATMQAIVQNLKRTIAELETQHKTDVDRIAELSKQTTDALMQCNAAHAAEVERIRADHKAELDRMRAELEDAKRELAEERQHSRDQSDQLATLADQAQKLQLAAMQPPALLEDQQSKPTLWQRLFKKK